MNPNYIRQIEKAGMVFSGKARGKPIMQIVELKNHPFFMASQYHPELTSTLDQPSKMFYQFVKTALATAKTPSSSQKQKARKDS